MTQKLLHFNGNDYFLDKVIAGASSGPKVEFGANEINLELQVKVHDGSSKELEADAIFHDMGQAIFYKFEGKYILLRGLSVAKKFLADNPLAKIKGQLISGPVLKRARKEEVRSGFESERQGFSGGSSYDARKPYEKPRYGDDRRGGYRSNTSGFQRQESATSTSRARSPYRTKRDVS